MQDKPVNLASLTPAPTQNDINKSVQTELRRVGCYSGNADGDWDSASQRSLSQFNRSAGLKLDVRTANADTLDAIRQKSSRVCPLVCEHGFKADGDHCTRIVCAEGSFVNDDNECEKRRAKTATREDEDRRPREEEAARERRPPPGDEEPRDERVAQQPQRGSAVVGVTRQDLLDLVVDYIAHAAHRLVISQSERAAGGEIGVEPR